MENHVRMVGKKSEEEEIFLLFLLSFKDDDEKVPLTKTHVKSLLMDMVLGRVDTSVNAAEFAMAESRPEVLKKVQEELDQKLLVGIKLVEESHIPKLLYLQAIMKETLRLHPTLSLLVPHRNSETSVVWLLFVNAWPIHRDPKNWENHEFKPERSLDSSFDFNGNDYKYLPLGERMVLYNLASLLHSFDWEAPKGERFEVEEKFGLVLKVEETTHCNSYPKVVRTKSLFPYTKSHRLTGRFDLVYKFGHVFLTFWYYVWIKLQCKSVCAKVL